jgi:hypothetical protein
MVEFEFRLKRENLVQVDLFAMGRLRVALEEENTVREVANMNVSTGGIRSSPQQYINNLYSSGGIHSILDLYFGE